MDLCFCRQPSTAWATGAAGQSAFQLEPAIFKLACTTTTPVAQSSRWIQLRVQIIEEFDTLELVVPVILNTNPAQGPQMTPYPAVPQRSQLAKSRLQLFNLKKCQNVGSKLAGCQVMWRQDARPPGEATVGTH